MTFVIKNLKPITIIESEGFREFMHIAMPEYIVPYRMTVIRQIYQTIAERGILKMVLKDIPIVGLTVDL